MGQAGPMGTHRSCFRPIPGDGWQQGIVQFQNAASAGNVHFGAGNFAVAGEKQGLGLTKPPGETAA